MLTITATTPPDSLCRVDTPDRPPLRVGLVQHRWHDDERALRAELTEGIATAAGLGARVVFLPELTLSRYPADTPGGTDAARTAEDLRTGPTVAFAAAAASAHGVFVHASLYERADGSDGLGYNTAVLVSPAGEPVARTRKLHIPVTAGYHEDTYFRGGPATDPYPVHTPAASTAPASACRPAGTSGSRRWRARTRSPGPRSSSTRRRSVPNPTIPGSTPARCGSR